MSSIGTVEEVIVGVSNSIESDIQDVDGFNEWVTTHGLGRTDSAEAIVARQAAFHVCLSAALYESYRSEQRDLSRLDSDTFHKSVSEACDVTRDDSFTDYFLTDVSKLFDEDDLARLIEAKEQFVSATDPAETIG